MKHLLAVAFITLLALGMGCAWISPASETASEGIQVHGHWTVTVTNPDGTLDAVHEFDNELIGKRLLIDLLIGSSLVDPDVEGTQVPQPHSGWFIFLDTKDTNAQLFCDKSATSLGTTKLSTLVDTDKNEGILYLGAGCTIVAIDSPNNTYSIDEVSTFLSAIKYVKTSPDNFNLVTVGSTMLHGFTRHTLTDPIVVDDQQVIAINVTISFE